MALVSILIQQKGGDAILLGGKGNDIEFTDNYHSTITGGNHGIKASTFGAISITTTGTVTGVINDGIYARNSGSGTTNITVSGTVNGGTGAGITTLTSKGQAVTNITLNSGASVSATSGLAITNDTGDSTVTVSTGASITGSIDLGTGTDQIILNGGTLNVANSFPALAVTGNLINNSGIVNAQNGTAGDTVTVNGNFTQAVGGTLRLGAVSDTEHGSLVVSGTATFSAGTTIDVDVATVNTLTTNSELLDVISAGTLVASGFTVTDNSALLNFSARIDGNTVDLLAEGSQSIVEATTIGGKPATLGAAAVFDTAPSGLADVITELNLLATEQEVANAIESTTPGVSGGVSQMTSVATNAVTAAVASRQNQARGLSSGDGFMADRHIWLKPFGGWTDQDDRQGVTGYDVDSYGLAIGFDGDISSTWNVGFALAYINSDVESNLAAGSNTIDMDSYLAKVYATKMLDEVTALNLQVGAGLSNYDSKRRIFTGDVADADYDSWNIQLSAELERSYQVGNKNDCYSLCSC